MLYVEISVHNITRIDIGNHGFLYTIHDDSDGDSTVADIDPKNPLSKSPEFLPGVRSWYRRMITRDGHTAYLLHAKTREALLLPGEEATAEEVAA